MEPNKQPPHNPDSTKARAQVQSNSGAVAESFFGYFTPVYTPLYADNPELVQETQRIRHEVYCEEFGFEPRTANGLEVDPHDAHAHHVLLKHNASAVFAGSARLVTPGGERSLQRLPLYQHCWQCIAPQWRERLEDDAGRCGEISRLAVRAQFRRRQQDLRLPAGSVGESNASVDAQQTRRTLPFIALGIYLSIAAVAEILHRRGQLDAVFVMMEPRLYRNLKIHGIRFEQIGEVADYHGKRAPFIITEQGLSQALNPDVAEIINALIDRFTTTTAGLPLN